MRGEEIQERASVIGSVLRREKRFEDEIKDRKDTARIVSLIW